MFKRLKMEEKWLILAIPILFILGTLDHFLYDLSNKNIIVGLISPVNESIWEHGKLVLLPTILFWVIFYVIKGNEYSINKNKWFTSALISLITMIITIPMLYYFYTGAFGIELMWIDISILLLANIVGQFIGLHFYRYSKGINTWAALLLISLVMLIFVIFTFYQPHVPIFKDSETGLYGI